jgi:hypothetical protein
MLKLYVGGDGMCDQRTIEAGRWRYLLTDDDFEAVYLNCEGYDL